jgi:hypothetical protein
MVRSEPERTASKKNIGILGADIVGISWYGVGFLGASSEEEENLIFCKQSPRGRGCIDPVLGTSYLQRAAPRASETSQRKHRGGEKGWPHKNGHFHDLRDERVLHHHSCSNDRVGPIGDDSRG